MTKINKSKYLSGVLMLVLAFSGAHFLTGCGGGGGSSHSKDTTPDTFTFIDQTDIPISTVVTSNTIVVSGINASTSVSITGGEYSIDSGAFTSINGTIGNGQSIQLKQTSSAALNSTVDSTLTIGSVSDTFSTTTIAIAADTTPDTFTFIDQTDIPISTVVTSNTIIVSGINTSTSVSITGGEYSIDSGTFTSLNGAIENGQSIQLRQTSSAALNSTVDSTLTIGSVSDTFSTTTIATDITPDAFSFIDQTDILRKTVVTSNTVIVSGIDASASASVSITGGEYSIDGGVFTSFNGSIGNGQMIQLRQTSSAALNTTVDTTLTIGNVSDIFSTTTITPAAAAVGGWSPYTSTLLYGHSSIWAQDKLLVWGGTDGEYKAVTAGELIDPAVEGKGSSLSSLGAPTSNYSNWAIASVANNPVYVLISRYSTSGSRIYDKANDSWSPVSSVNHPTNITKVLGVGEYIAGWDANGNGWLYDVVNDSWQAFPITGAPTEANCCGAISANDSQIFMWGSYARENSPYTYTQSGFILNVTTNTWTTLPITVNTPTARFQAQSVWDGDSFIVWGGYTANTNPNVPDGARYNPSTSIWTPVSTTNAPVDSTGTLGLMGADMVLVQDQNVFIYNTLSNSWSSGGTTPVAISERTSYSMNFTDTDIYFLGGTPRGTPSSSLMTGRLHTYNLSNKSWSHDSSIEPPVIASNGGSSGGSASLIWDPVDSRAILWSAGFSDYQGGKFNPTDMTWSAISMSGAPTGYTASNNTSTAWSGTDMLTWSANFTSGSGSTYNPQTDSWTLWNETGKHAAPDPMFVWLGAEVFVWSNSSTWIAPTSTGSLYNPVTDTWRAISEVNAPEAKLSTFTPAAAIGNNKLLIWSGYDYVNGTASPTGHIFDATNNSWTSMSSVDEPEPRYSYGGVWTGSRYIVWGGILADGSDATTGGMYDPATDTWNTISSVDAPAVSGYPVAVWTGTQALFWNRGVGGLYDLATDIWTPLSTINSPSGGAKPLGVWMGDSLLIINGYNSASNTGAVWRP